jgi:ABC-type branched-subunit amino acid transport system ATPase component
MLAGHKRVRLGIGQAPEGRGIFPGMTVQENLLMGAYARKGELAQVYDLFPAWPSARASTAARCPAARSRCSPSAGR